MSELEQSFSDWQRLTPGVQKYLELLARGRMIDETEVRQRTDLVLQPEETLRRISETLRVLESFTSACPHPVCGR